VGKKNVQERGDFNVEWALHELGAGASNETKQETWANQENLGKKRAASTLLHTAQRATTNTAKHPS